MNEVFAVFQDFEGVMDCLGVFASREGAEKAKDQWVADCGWTNVSYANDFKVVSLKVNP